MISRLSHPLLALLPCLRPAILGALWCLSSLCWPASAKAETTNASGATQITSLPITITTSGTYYLSQNFTASFSMQAILIHAAGVTIDLNGHTITNTSTSGSVFGIVSVNQPNNTILNGTLVGFNTGIYLLGYTGPNGPLAGFGELVENVSCVSTSNVAFWSVDSSYTRFKHCRAILTGASSGSGICAFSISGANGDVIEDCDVMGKTGTAAVTGISVTYNASNNFIVNNRISGVDSGVSCDSSSTCKYRDNLTLGVTTPYSGGTNGGNNN